MKQLSPLDQMGEVAFEFAAEFLATAGLLQSLEDARALKPVIYIFAFGATGVAYDRWHKTDDAMTKNFYWQAADFVAVEILGVKRRGFLITTGNWRQVMSKLDDFLYNTIFQNFELIGFGDPEKLMMENLDWTRENATTNFNLDPDEIHRLSKDRDEIRLFIGMMQASIESFNQLANDVVGLVPIKKEYYFIIIALLARIFSKLNAKLRSG